MRTRGTHTHTHTRARAHTHTPRILAIARGYVRHACCVWPVPCLTCNTQACVGSAGGPALVRTQCTGSWCVCCWGTRGHCASTGGHCRHCGRARTETGACHADFVSESTKASASHLTTAVLCGMTHMCTHTNGCTHTRTHTHTYTYRHQAMYPGVCPQRPRQTRWPTGVLCCALYIVLAHVSMQLARLTEMSDGPIELCDLAYLEERLREREGVTMPLLCEPLTLESIMQVIGPNTHTHTHTRVRARAMQALVEAEHGT